MIFRVKHIYVTVSPLFFAVAIWALLADKAVPFGLCLMALSLHEMGHIVMIYLLQEKIAIFRIIPFGFSCRLKNQSKIVPEKMIKILFAGPVVNFLTAGLFFLGTKEFAMMNLLLGMFNLLPIGELDGGRIFQIVETKRGK
ncbi:MAG: hypothetical protein J6M02_03425 [Clostridia bacterium]|nr:hypothetical protein [Clostridia bacterium]